GTRGCVAVCQWTVCSARAVVVFFQAEDGIRDWSVTGVQTCALPISSIDGIPHRIEVGGARGGVLVTMTATGAFVVPRGQEDLQRSEERRVGKECRTRWSPGH